MKPQTIEIPRPSLRYYFAGLLSGILYAASMPGYVGFLGFFALLPWAYCSLHAPSRAWRIDLLFFLSLFSLSCYWIGYVSWVGAVLVILTETALVLPTGWVYRRLARLMPVTLALPLVWSVMEFLRTRYPIDGLPFAVLGFSQYENINLIQVADLFGVGAVSFWVAMLNGLWVDAMRAHPQIKRLAGLVLLILLMLLGYGLWRRSSLERSGSEQVSIGLVQANVKSDSKGEPEPATQVIQRHVEMTQSLLQKGYPDLLIWSESSFPWPLADPVKDLSLTEGFTSSDAAEVEAGLKNLIFNRLGLRGKSHFLGGFYYYAVENGQVSVRNAAVLFSKDGERSDLYFKRHLVPGGEYIPDFGIISWLAEQFAGLEGFRGKMGVMLPGDATKVFTFAGKEREYKAGIAICYDNAYADLFLEATQMGAQFHIVLSNEAWYGNSNEFEQLLAASVFRAVETRRSIVRATNSGISVVLSPTGEIAKQVSSPEGRKQVSGILEGPVSLSQSQAPYTIWGDLPWWAALSVLFVFTLWPKKVRNLSRTSN